MKNFFAFRRPVDGRGDSFRAFEHRCKVADVVISYLFSDLGDAFASLQQQLLCQLDPAAADVAHKALSRFLIKGSGKMLGLRWHRSAISFMVISCCR